MKHATKMLMMSRTSQRTPRYSDYDRRHDAAEREGVDDRRREKTDWSKSRMYETGATRAELGEKPEGHLESHAKEVDQAVAMEWVHRMKNADGTTGPHYKPEQAEQLRVVHCPHCKRWEFFVALNMMYSDYSEVARKMGVDKPEFYVHMAKAFLEDQDAGEHKLIEYMEHIPK